MADDSGLLHPVDSQLVPGPRMTSSASSPQVAARRILACLMLTAAVAGVALTALAPQHVKAGTEADAAAAARTAYSQKMAKEYSYRFAPDKPFLPSNMATDNGEFIDPKSMPSAQYCAHCHQEAHAQWRQSAHSNATRCPYYRPNVTVLNAEKGISFSRHCGGCHDPLAVAAGAITEGAPRKRPYDQDGVTCMVCHSIQSVDTRGTGSFVLAAPAGQMEERGTAPPPD